jgi:hypothetical protein
MPRLFALRDFLWPTEEHGIDPGVAGFLPDRFRALPTRTQRRCAGALMLAVLVLTIPILVAANPVDLTWQHGWHDDADTDDLVTQTLSPDSLIVLAVLVLVVQFSVRVSFVDDVAEELDAGSTREPVPKGLPPVTVSRPRSLVIRRGSSCLHAAGIRRRQRFGWPGGRGVLAWVVGVCLFVLTPLSYLTDPDPLWMGGLWDDDDGDAVVVMVQSTQGPCASVPSVFVPLVPCRLHPVAAPVWRPRLRPVRGPENRAPPRV